MELDHNYFSLEFASVNEESATLLAYVKDFLRETASVANVEITLKVLHYISCPCA